MAGYTRDMLKPLVTLIVIGVVAAATLASVNLVTRDRIELERQRQALAALHQVVPPERYDNELVRDRFSAWIAGLEAPSTIYRARDDGAPVALVADVTTMQGYSGAIRLLVGFDLSGEVIAVRVIEHRETPGLGDKIELQRSDWIRQFSGSSLDEPVESGWKPDRRGGEFDTLSSATITSSAVIGAVRQVLEWYQANCDRVFEIPVESE